MGRHGRFFRVLPLEVVVCRLMGLKYPVCNCLTAYRQQLLEQAFRFCRILTNERGEFPQNRAPKRLPVLPSVTVVKAEKREVGARIGFADFLSLDISIFLYLAPCSCFQIADLKERMSS